jgi:phosphopantothenoylcysteine decarboxylase
MKKILLGVTGSVAAKLTPRMVARLLENDYQVQIIATKPSFYFWDEGAVDVPVYREEDEWPGERYERDQMILHIELREWADALLIAPLTANTLAKMANGFCDNLLTSVVRAWNLAKPMIVAPAMNTQMWNKCITDKHLAIVSMMYRAKIIEPVAKTLACGEQGIGAMAEIETIVGCLDSWRHHIE